MTREDIEQLNTVEPYCFESDREEQWYQVGLKEGLEVADKHLINVWHDTSEEPILGSNIVAIDSDGEWWDIQPYTGDYDWNGLKGWRSCVRTYDIQKWAYIDDLLPKGCEK